MREFILALILLPLSYLIEVEIGINQTMFAGGNDPLWHLRLLKGDLLSINKYNEYGKRTTSLMQRILLSLYRIKLVERV